METPTLDSPDLPLNDYRALREGREVARVTIEEKPASEAPPAGTPAAAESAAESETAGETVEEQPSEDGQNKESKPPAKRGLVDEISKLRRENRELKARVTPPPQPQPKPGETPAEGAQPDASKLGPDGLPDINKYTDYTLYQRDLVRGEIRKAQEEQAAEAARRQTLQAESTKLETWKARVKTVAASKPDFEVVALDPSLEVSNVMRDAILDAENGPDILYHLGSHPDEAARISKLSTVAQIREVGKLEASLLREEAGSTSAVVDEQAPQKTAISKAPAPIPRPNGSASKPNPVKNLEGMSQAEYRELRESGRLR